MKSVNKKKLFKNEQLPSKVSYVSLYAIFTLHYLFIFKKLVPSKENQNIFVLLQIKIMPATILIFD